MICSRCGMDKDRSEFYSGGSTYCRECKKEYAKEYRANNLSLVKEKQRQWRELNPDYVPVHSKGSAVDYMDDCIRCKKCDVFRPLSYFYRKGDYITMPCKACRGIKEFL